jgi:hypothetical protein
MSSHEEKNMTSDRLLTEIERQQKYLAQLPENFEFPLFNSKQALESQRKNGYRDTAAAAREIVDNAIEAGAKRIDVIFEHSKSEQGKDLITSIAFIDDGSGMLPKMIQYALSLGGGTHFEDSDFIGKFGFGLPNASINQTKRVEVYSRTMPTDDLMKAELDVQKVKLHGLQTINPAEKAELPSFVQKYLAKHGLEFETGTVVVWVAPDRLTYKTGARLKEHLLDDFGITYRYLLKVDKNEENEPDDSNSIYTSSLQGIDLFVESVRVKVTDPLFLNPSARFYLAPDENEASDSGGAVEKFNRTFVVKHFRDPDTEVNKVEYVDPETPIDENDENLLTFGTVHVRVSRLPYGFAAEKGNDEDSKRRLEIRINGRGISFVRAGREIETLKIFPHTERDKNSGLGSWLPLQSYDYHWACEIKFKPELDEVFGITNDKQKVRPLEDLWRVLANDIGLDRVLREEHNWQRVIRAKKAKERKNAKQLKETEPSSEPSLAEMAAANTDAVTGRGTNIPERDKSLVKGITDAEIDDKVKITNATREEVKKAQELERKRRPYKVEYFEDVRGAFYEPKWGVMGQVIVQINRKHPFFEAVYGTLFSIEGGLKAKSAIDLFLIALAKAELETEIETTKLLYEVQRTEIWSPFLVKSLKILEQTMKGDDSEIEIDDDTRETETRQAAVVS